MHRVTLAVVLSLLSLATLQPVFASAAAGDPVLDAEEKAFCKRINQYRAQKGRPALRVSVSLTKASRWLSADMGAKSYFDHTDSLGRSFTSRMKAFGYAFSTSKAENIAAGKSTGAAAFEQWRTSAGHNTNMLNAAYKVIGIGRSYKPGSAYGWYWTTDFGGTADRTMAC